MRELGGEPEQELEPIRATAQGTMRRRLWHLPWGKVLVCRLHQHPARCGVDLSDALTKSAAPYEKQKLIPGLIDRPLLAEVVIHNIAVLLHMTSRDFEDALFIHRLSALTPGSE